MWPLEHQEDLNLKLSLARTGYKTQRYILQLKTLVIWVGGIKLKSLDFSQNKIISFVLARSRIDKLRTMGVAHWPKTHLIENSMLNLSMAGLSGKSCNNWPGLQCDSRPYNRREGAQVCCSDFVIVVYLIILIPVTRFA